MALKGNWKDLIDGVSEVRVKPINDIASSLIELEDKIPEALENGKTPYIKNGNWWIGDTDTGVKAKGTDGKDGINGTGLYRGTVVFDEDSASSDETEIVETIDKPNGEPFIVGDMVIDKNGKIWRIFDNKGHVTVVTSTKGEKGDPYTLTDTDKTEIAAKVVEMLGGNPIFGYVDKNNNIILSGNLADGDYTVKYEMEDGSTVDIGNLVLDTEEEPIEPTNFFVVGGDGYLNPGRASSAGADRTDVTACFLTNYIEVQNGDEIYLYGAHSSNAKVGNMGLYKADKTGVGFYVRTTASDPYLNNVSLWDEVDIFTITYEEVVYMRACCLIPDNLSTIKINIKRNGEWL